MADLKITQLTSYTPPIATDVIPITDVTTGITKKIAWSNLVPPKASQAQAEAGTEDTTYMTPLKTKQSIVENALNSIAIVKYEYDYISKLGDSSTRFDITNPAGTTFRYTWDGTGADPVINSTTFPVGTIVYMYLGSVGNKGTFTVTGSGTNYFEVTNAAGVAENDKYLNSSYPSRRVAFPYLYTIPATLKQLEIEMCGGGSGGDYSGSGSASTNPTTAGAYLRKMYTRTQLTALGYTTTIPILIGLMGGRDAGAVAAYGGGYTQFGNDLKTEGGMITGVHSVATGGDLNINGGISPVVYGGTYSKHGGAASYFGGAAGYEQDATVYGGSGGGAGTGAAGNGKCGVCILTEHY